MQTMGVTRQDYDKVMKEEKFPCCHLLNSLGQKRTREGERSGRTEVDAAVRESDNGARRGGQGDQTI